MLLIEAKVVSRLEPKHDQTETCIHPVAAAAAASRLF
jgi:hypothetical protein